MTENLQQTTTLWSTTNPEVRYLSYIDHIDQECCAQASTHKPFISSTYKLKESLIIIPLEKKGEVHDPRPGHGIYSNMKIPISSESPATYAEEDIPDNSPSIIENNDKSELCSRPSSWRFSQQLNYISEHMWPTKIPVELKIAMHEDNLNTPAPGPEITDEANNNFVDLSIDSWLTIDSIGTTPAVEKVCPIEIEDFLEEF